MPAAQHPCSRSGITGRLRGELGAATAETAIIMVAVSALLLLLVGVGGLVIQQVQLTEGTRTVARDVMRGVPDSEAIDAGQQIAGPNARFSISRSGDIIHVSGREDVPVGGPLVGHTITVSAETSTRLEPHLVSVGSP